MWRQGRGSRKHGAENKCPFYASVMGKSTCRGRREAQGRESLERVHRGWTGKHIQTSGSLVQVVNASD